MEGRLRGRAEASGRVKVRVIVPRRADGGIRDRLWDLCRPAWERFEIREGHHDDGPFNRSAAINSAATGRWDVAVIVDADITITDDQVDAAIAHSAKTGRVTLPYRRRMLVSDRATQRILGGYRGSWESFATPDRNTEHCSSCVVVPRILWDQVGGFDERFIGWGAEDEAFIAACEHDAGVDRLDGDVWHLHHPPAPWKDHRSPDYRAALGLLDRYRTDTDNVLRESRADDQIVVVIVTNGARDTLAKTVHSAEQMLQGPIGRRVICDGSKGTHGRIAQAHPDWNVVDTGQDPGYGLAMRRAYEVELGSGQPWIVHLEDDFTFNQPVDLVAMQNLMRANPHMAQLALLRQPWYENEIAAGGIFQANPERFTQHDGWVGHRAFWTSNPHLTRRSFLARHQWPTRQWSEGRFGREVLKDRQLELGFLGTLDDPPRVTHIGVERAGRGY